MPTVHQPIHPLGKRARVLLTSVFGPYSRDDEYGSRKINPMELYQNQVTRVQGGFSLRMFHRSFGLMMIQNNLNAPCTLLDFPTLEGFTAQITDNRYDVIGISAIVPNIGKVREMCRLIRRHQPGAVIVIGGHISNKEGLHELIDADHIVRGEGIRWFQRYPSPRSSVALAEQPELTQNEGTSVLLLKAFPTPVQHLLPGWCPWEAGPPEVD